MTFAILPSADAAITGGVQCGWRLGTMSPINTMIDDSPPSARASIRLSEPTKRRLCEEQRWRRPDPQDSRVSDTPPFSVFRSIGNTDEPHDEDSAPPDGRHVVSITLRAARVKLFSGNDIVFEGMMPSGILHLSSPARGLRAQFRSCYDFIHFYLCRDYGTECRTLSAPVDGCPRKERQDRMLLDPLSERLCRTLVVGDPAGNEAYTEIVGRTLLVRVLGKQPDDSKVGALQNWRLKRVLDYVATHREGRIGLADLADAAGLSRMHFAAQFKVATGCRPHDYLLRYRIGFAKTVMLGENMPLAEVALAAGFQDQTHFTTVFKRLTGDTPAHWRRTQLAAHCSGSSPGRVAIDVPQSKPLAASREERHSAVHWHP